MAIVSEVEGTTRDALEARIELASVPVIFTDTAGIRSAHDFLEAESISRTIARLIVYCCIQSLPESISNG